MANNTNLNKSNYNNRVPRAAEVEKKRFQQSVLHGDVVQGGKKQFCFELKALETYLKQIQKMSLTSNI